MKRITIACIMIALACLTRPAQAQLTAVQQHNARMMDSLQMEVIAIWCHEQLDFPTRYNRHKTEQVTHILQTLNTLYTDTLTRTALREKIKSFRDGRVTIDSSQNGGDTSSVEVRIDLPDYLLVRLQFTCAGGQVVAQRYELQPGTKLWNSEHTRGFFDFNYCKTVYAPTVDFPLHFARNEYFYASIRL